MCFCLQDSQLFSPFLELKQKRKKLKLFCLTTVAKLHFHNWKTVHYFTWSQYRCPLFQTVVHKPLRDDLKDSNWITIWKSHLHKNESANRGILSARKQPKRHFKFHQLYNTNSYEMPNRYCPEIYTTISKLGFITIKKGPKEKLHLNI